MALFTIYTKDYCPYCVKAKNILTQEGWDYEEKDITRDQSAFSELKQRTGHMTVPQIFLGETFIGGADDLERKLPEVRQQLSV